VDVLIALSLALGQPHGMSTLRPAFIVVLAACGASSPQADPPPIPDTTTATADEVRQWIDAYQAAHPGHGGKDWDVNAKSDAELATDPDALALVGICGAGQRPVIPRLAWEYGGNDHPWIAPVVSALVYCVYTPSAPSTENWSYDPTADHVVADLYVKFPAENPCAAEIGAAQVAACIGDPTNFEILVDTISRNDGADVGLSLSEASTEVRLILVDGTKVHLIDNL